MIIPIPQLDYLKRLIQLSFSFSLSLSLGVGVVLIIVSGIAWRLTSNGPTWRALFGFGEIPSTVGLPGSTLESTARRFLPRVPDPHGRSGAHHHPYGAMFYPEFQYRPPPPSYQASMQEYRLRLLLLERSSSQTQPTSLSPVSPPPTYRSSAASSLAGKNPSCFIFYLTLSLHLEMFSTLLFIHRHNFCFTTFHWLMFQ